MKKGFKKITIVSIASVMLFFCADLSFAAGGGRGGRSGAQCTGYGWGQQTNSGYQHRYGQGRKSATANQQGGYRYGDGSKPQPQDGTGFGAKAKDAAPSN